MPYAAKAIIEHEFNIDHIDIWITFRLPMKICSDPINNPTVFDVKPPDEKWIVELDGIETAISESNWLDEFTMHLLIENAAASPDELLVSYDGPDINLRTSWDKQWEPWVEILSTDLSFTLWQTGMIILWSGSIATIPNGWSLCDGNNGTPNLQNKFVIAAGDTYAVDATGGSLTHNHTFVGNTHQHVLNAGSGVAAGPNLSQSTDAQAVSGSVQNKSAIQPYYALAYIMKL
jgi:microcystin-dependent protein